MNDKRPVADPRKTAAHQMMEHVLGYVDQALASVQAVNPKGAEAMVIAFAAGKITFDVRVSSIGSMAPLAQVVAVFTDGSPERVIFSSVIPLRVAKEAAN